MGIQSWRDRIKILLIAGLLILCLYVTGAAMSLYTSNWANHDPEIQATRTAWAMSHSNLKAPPDSTTQPVVEPSPEPKVIARNDWPTRYASSFALAEKNDRDWPRGPFVDARFSGERSFLAGAYRWEFRSDEGGTLVAIGGHELVTEMYLTTYARQFDGSSNAEYGAVFGYLDQSNYYRIGIRNSQLIVTAVEKGVEAQVWSHRSETPGSLFVRLSVSEQGKKLRFFLNDAYLGEKELDRMVGGRYGLYVGLPPNSNGMFEFGNFEVQAPDRQTPTMPPGVPG